MGVARVEELLLVEALAIIGSDTCRESTYNQCGSGCVSLGPMQLKLSRQSDVIAWLISLQNNLVDRPDNVPNLQKRDQEQSRCR